MNEDVSMMLVADGYMVMVKVPNLGRDQTGRDVLAEAARIIQREVLRK